MLSIPPLGARLLAEFVGTATLVAVGIAAIANDAGLLGVALAHGLAIGVMVSATGHVSGGHLNPAVTVAMMALRKSTIGDGLAYIATQLAAGVAAAAFMKWALQERWTDAKATVALGQGVGTAQAVALEVLATFFLVWVVFAVAVDRDGSFFKIAGLPIGFAVTMDILMIGPLTGATMNPARWLGPNLVTGSWDDAIVWIAGPLVGAVLAGFAYMYGVRPRLQDAAA